MSDTNQHSSLPRSAETDSLVTTITDSLVRLQGWVSKPGSLKWSRDGLDALYALERKYDYIVKMAQSYMAEVERLEEQLEAAQDLLHEWRTLGYSAGGGIGGTLNARTDAALAGYNPQHGSSPASQAAASTDAVSPAPGHQRSDHPESPADSSPASEPTPLQRAYGGKVRTVNTDPSNQDRDPAKERDDA